jgi:uncharacterized repeat protein (TIGR03837 family)
MTATPLIDAAPRQTWDVFCQVVDNWGDLGVCWRLATQLAEQRQTVRLWVDDPEPLTWMAPDHRLKADIEVRHWPRTSANAMPPKLQPGNVLIEAFGCDIPPLWVNALLPPQGVWINLEYLSAAPFVERCHKLPSPVLSGPLAGRQKWFFYPGFTPKTGGLLGLGALSSGPAVCSTPPTQGDTAHTPKITLFCYEPAALPDLLGQPGLALAEWRVAAGRTQQAFDLARHHLPNTTSQLQLPHLSQTEFDQLLATSDVNFVRGEDSLVRALWAGKPFVWQIYPQTDNAHHGKLEAFLDWLNAPTSWRHFHRVWNGLVKAPLPPLLWQEWRACAQQARQRLLQQDDLVTQLIRFVSEKQ